MLMLISDLVKAAQEYDLENRPRNPDMGWRRVSDSQVARLLIGALNARRDSEQRQAPLTPPGG